MKERYLVAGLLVIGAITGGGAAVQHEREQSSRIESLTQESLRRGQAETVGGEGISESLRAELLNLWIASCINQARSDIALEGQTDITPDPAGLELCMKYFNDWGQDFKGGEVK